MNVLKLRAFAERVAGMVDRLYWRLRVGASGFLGPQGSMYALTPVPVRNVEVRVSCRQLDGMEKCRDDG